MQRTFIGPAGHPVRGECRVPSDKSIAHRALLLGAAADGVTRIRNCELGADNRSTMAFVRALGVVVRERVGEVRVAGGGWDALRTPAETIDCGNSGTTMRLGLGLLAGRPFDARLTGDASLCRRPMARVIEPLRAMGASVTCEGAESRPPIAIRGAALRGVAHRLAVASAQVKSAILLAGLQARGTTTVIEPEPTRDHTERMLASFGVPLRIEREGGNDGRRISVEGGAVLRAASVTLPGDFSSAAFFLVAALLVPGSDLLISDVGLNPTRTGLLDVLREMGADCEVVGLRDQDGGEPIGALRVRACSLRAVTVDPILIPRLVDEVPILCVAAACAAGVTTITGARELRVKESDRLAVMARELRGRGVDVEELPDGLVIEGRGGRGAAPLEGGLAATDGDHRIAMAMAVAGLVAREGIDMDGADAAEISFPGFYVRLRALVGG
jgi:3-phosphoshikimate 1-carboxyvinyltransferase